MRAFVIEQVRRQELQRDGALELVVLGLVHDTHPSLTELLGDAVMADGSADHAGPILPRCGQMVGTTDPLTDPIVPRAGR